MATTERTKSNNRIMGTHLRASHVIPTALARIVVSYASTVFERWPEGLVTFSKLRRCRAGECWTQALSCDLTRVCRSCCYREFTPVAAAVAALVECRRKGRV